MCTTQDSAELYHTTLSPRYSWMNLDHETLLSSAERPVHRRSEPFFTLMYCEERATWVQPGYDKRSLVKQHILMHAPFSHDTRSTFGIAEQSTDPTAPGQAPQASSDVLMAMHFDPDRSARHRGPSVSKHSTLYDTRAHLIPLPSDDGAGDIFSIAQRSRGHPTI